MTLAVTNRPLLAACLVASIVAVPTEAWAGWEQEQSTVIDSFGITGEHPELELVVATQGVLGPTKMQGLVYKDAAQGKIAYASREAPVGDALVTQSWSVQTVSPVPIAFGNLAVPRLAMDPATGTPYVLYVGGSFGASETLWLSSYVGTGAGNCGSSLAWLCENVTEICELAEVLSTSPLLELGGAYGAASDTVHIIDLESGFMHIRKDLETNDWACDDVSGSAGPYLSEPYRADSMVIRHEFDERVKPQVAYLAHREGSEQDPLQFFFRSLLNYAGTPLPPWSWTDENPIGLTSESIRWTYPSLALVDDGLSGPAPSLTGYGLAAVAYLEQDDIDTSGPAVACIAPRGTSSWPLQYKKAWDVSGWLWEASEVVTDGEPCHPSLDVGWDGNPYVAFADQATDGIALTTRRPITGWEPPQLVAADASTPSIAYDPDDGSISIAYHDIVARDVVVVDGWWVE